jgi:hypothetical protein
MGELVSRRWVLVAWAVTAALGAANVAVRASMDRSTRQAMRYEDYLAALFKAGHGDLRAMALAHIGGFADRVPGWLASARQGASRSSTAPTLRRVFDALLTGDVPTIEAALRAEDVRDLDFRLQGGRKKLSTSDPRWLDHALGIAVDPLILLGRADLLPALHTSSLRRLGAEAISELTTDAVRQLAAATEWEHALEILQQARRTGAGIKIESSDENLIWKYAYLHRRVDTVMPVLAVMPFSPEFPLLAEWREWKFKGYQVRAGTPAIVVPVIEGKQPHGYGRTAVMQIAALADDPSAAEFVRNLRRVVKPTTLEFVLVDQGIRGSTTDLPQGFSTAEAQIAARRKDYAKLAELARRPSVEALIDPPTDVIDALLDEGDWRAAADIAREHDPRQQRLVPGFTDNRAFQSVQLYEQLALGAAWDGDDAAAAILLAKAKEIDRTERRDGDSEASDAALHFSTMLLAGLAEGLLPRKHLHVLTWAFRPPF